MRKYELTGQGEWAEIEFVYQGKEVFGHLNTLISDGGFYHGYHGENFTEFDQPTMDWLEEIEHAHREKEREKDLLGA